MLVQRARHNQRMRVRTSIPPCTRTDTRKGFRTHSKKPDNRTSISANCIHHRKSGNSRQPHWYLIIADLRPKIREVGVSVNL